MLRLAIAAIFLLGPASALRVLRRAALAARMRGDVSATSLEGVDYLKAQYYGVARVFEDKVKARKEG